MEVRYEIITPEVAQEYLEKNVGNYRQINKSRVAEYATDMKFGRWKDNGESIKFSKSGHLADGQHRLMAICKSGTPIGMYVVRGVDDDCSTFDVGQPRTSSQILVAEGTNPAASNQHSFGAARILVTGRFVYRSGKQMQSAQWASTNALVREYAKSHQVVLADSYRIVMTNSGHSGATLSRKSPVIAAVYCMLRRGENKEKLFQFFNVVNTGFPIDGVECTPALALRNQLLAHKGISGTSESCRMHDFSSTVKAYDDFRNGVPGRRSYRLAPSNDRGLAALLYVVSRDNFCELEA